MNETHERFSERSGWFYDPNRVVGGKKWQASSDTNELTVNKSGEVAKLRRRRVGRTGGYTVGLSLVTLVQVRGLQAQHRRALG